MKLLSILFFVFVQEAVFGKSLTNGVPNKLLYILIDGFRYDYVEMQPAIDLPGFNKFLREGVRAKWMTPLFPSHSLPNWVTLVTGLWAESHGIVGDYIYDSTNEDVFQFTHDETMDDKKWWTAEPIYITATKAGLKAGIIRGARCDIPYDDLLPEHCNTFNHFPQHDRLFFTNNTETALTLLENGYDLVQLYTSYIDYTGHSFGPETDHMKKSVQFVDENILHLLQELEDRELDDKVNIIIVSDHGMKDIYPGVAVHIELDDYLDLDLIESIVQYGAYSNIKTVPGAADQVYNDLQKVKGVKVYNKKDIPLRFHYKNHQYIHEILIVANNGFYIMGSRSDKQIPRRQDNQEEEKKIADNGFDPMDEKMRAIFFAKGPDFKKNKRIPAIQNVDVYPLLAHLLKVDPLPNNGTIVHLEDALKYPIERRSKIIKFLTGIFDYLENI